MSRNFFLLLFFSVILSSIISIPCSWAATAPEITSLVREAATLVEQKGKDAFAEFRQLHGEDFAGDVEPSPP